MVSVLDIEQERLMVWLTLLFVVTLTTVSKVTSLHCSDQQLPASGDDDLQQVTTLQYCLVDNCTIMMIDTGEELDIVYTTNGLIVATPTDGHTSMMITKQKNEVPCKKHSNMDLFKQFQGVKLVLALIIFAFAIMINALIIGLHVFFKELITPVGKLLMLYNFLSACVSTIAIVYVLQYQVAHNSLMFCYIFSLAFMLTALGIRLCRTCILYHIVYVMYCSSKLLRITPEMSRRMSKYYKAYQLGTILLTLFFIVSYDVVTGYYKGLLLPNSHCAMVAMSHYDTFLSISTLNYVAQLFLLIAYLYYTYHLNKDISDVAILDS